MSENKEFNVVNALLDKRNLIEASAGTGKTYSIAILVLRLLLEKSENRKEPILINEILMVTFTNYAVAELETRVRLFVRTAYDYCKNNNPDCDKTIAEVVDNSIQKIGREKTILLLKQAVLMLDETSIMTIHGFCQQTLTAFAFDTGQLFGAKATSKLEFDSLINDVLNECWRERISTLKKVLCYSLIDNKFEKENAQKILTIALSGKKMTQANNINYSLDDQEELIEEIKTIENSQEELLENLQADLDQNKENYFKRIQKLTTSKKWNKESFNSPINLFASLKSSPNQKIRAEFGDFFIQQEEYDRLEQERKNSRLIVIEKVINYVTDKGVKKVELLKEKNSVFSFDDMIQRVAQAVRENSSFCEQLRNKYKAVFVDEFQDTDKDQYEIFNTVFQKDTLLFYIGDPKQSIYAFRKADINTYFKARAEGVDRILEMNTNFRSSTEVVNALNVFFKPNPTFDTFHYAQDRDGISYIPVKTPADKSFKTLYINGEAQKPLSIFKQATKGVIPTGVAANVAQLLKDGFLIGADGKKEKIKPSDIGILVRDRYGADHVKKALSNYKIPAVTIDDKKILESKEAKEMLYVLIAIDDIKKSNINRALLTTFTGYNIDKLLAIDEEKTLNRFKAYKDAWTAPGKGIFVALMKFITDYNVRAVLQNRNAENSTRIVSNLLQLIELLHTVSVRKQYSPTELINWLSAATNGKSEDGDEFEQRMESDENAVTIITIHKSKGLEYNIVFAPYLDFNADLSGTNSIVQFRNEEDGEYYFSNETSFANLYNNKFHGWKIKQDEQENRRLLYVALTRAKYKCYIHTAINAKESTMNYFLAALNESTISSLNNYIEIKETPADIPSNYQYISTNNNAGVAYKTCAAFSLEQINWRKLSYSALSPSHIGASIENRKNPEYEYDQFVFRDLKRGAKTGNLLHFIFENIDFREEKNWSRLTDSSVKRTGYSNKSWSNEMLIELLRNTLGAEIKTNSDVFSMNQVSNEQRLNELEFDFPLKPFHTDQLKTLAEEISLWDVKDLNDLEGIMNGKIDLFFEMNGKYYVLDWKSNYLGDAPEDYQEDRLSEAMAANNYNLQYHLYTVAVSKYLKTRLSDFNYERDFGGVIYLFLRGLRSGSNNAVFFHKPEWSNIVKLNDVLC